MAVLSPAVLSPALRDTRVSPVVALGWPPWLCWDRGLGQPGLSGPSASPQPLAPAGAMTAANCCCFSGWFLAPSFPESLSSLCVFPRR